MSDLIDDDKALKPMSVRERISIRIMLMLLRMTYPARWGSSFEKMIDEIKAELK